MFVRGALERIHDQELVEVGAKQTRSVRGPLLDYLADGAINQMLFRLNENFHEHYYWARSFVFTLPYHL